MLSISKSPELVGNLRRRAFPFPTARAAFKAFLKSADFGEGDVVLMPAYIGWSPREGSGVFDPVSELGLDAVFYRIDDRMHVDLAHYESQLKTHRVRVVLLIHYFGYVDPSFREAAELARQAGALILEDEAHAMLTDLIGGGCGRLGDACILSVHKMLPSQSGGMLILNDPDADAPADADQVAAFSPWDYDLLRISERRRENAVLLTRLLAPLAEFVDPLWPDLQPFEVPQTYPVLIRKVPRYDVYLAMNEAGYGVVSLYHTLIDKLPMAEYPASHRLADTILNLPTHQDVSAEDLECLVAQLERSCRHLSRSQVA